MTRVEELKIADGRYLYERGPAEPVVVEVFTLADARRFWKFNSEPTAFPLCDISQKRLTTFGSHPPRDEPPGQSSPYPRVAMNADAVDYPDAKAGRLIVFEPGGKVYECRPSDWDESRLDAEIKKGNMREVRERHPVAGQPPEGCELDARQAMRCRTTAGSSCIVWRHNAQRLAVCVGTLVMLASNDGVAGNGEQVIPRAHAAFAAKTLGGG